MAEINYRTGTIDTGALVREILKGYKLPLRGHHGVVHWARVLDNGLGLAEANDANVDVVVLFALFHDSRRVNEGSDWGHGRRGAELARSLRGTFVHLADAEFDLLYEACRGHTEGTISSDVTIQACWDADRLDLGRVGIMPEPERLGSDFARLLVPWAVERATQRVVPEIVVREWGV